MACYKEAAKYSKLNISTDSDLLNVHKSVISKAIAPILYLCSENQDFNKAGGNEFSVMKPTPKKAKNGIRYFPPEKPAFFEVGFKVGNTLRSISKDCESESRDSVRPHIRRAHWHTFLSGKGNSDRIRSLKWLSPILVNFDEMDVIPTVRNVIPLCSS